LSWQHNKLKVTSVKTQILPISTKNNVLNIVQHILGKSISWTTPKANVTFKQFPQCHKKEINLHKAIQNTYSLVQCIFVSSPITSNNNMNITSSSRPHIVDCSRWDMQRIADSRKLQPQFIWLFMYMFIFSIGGIWLLQCRGVAYCIV